MQQVANATTTTIATPVAVTETTVATPVAVTETKTEPMFETPAGIAPKLGKQIAIIGGGLDNSATQAFAQNAILWGHDIVSYSDHVEVFQGQGMPAEIPSDHINYPLRPKYLRPKGHTDKGCGKSEYVAVKK